MNDLDEFAEVAIAIFVAMTLLICLLTYLERTLTQPASERDARAGLFGGYVANRCHQPPTINPQAHFRRGCVC